MILLSKNAWYKKSIWQIQSEMKLSLFTSRNSGNNEMPLLTYIMRSKNMITDDGDIVRGLGFVTMHSAHLEGRIDELLSHLSDIEEITEKEQRWPVSQKIRKAKEILAHIDHPLASEICEDLDLCREHFEWRNELVHGRIYAPDYHEENLKSSRPNVPDRKATSEELYTLANNLVELDSRVYRPMIIQLPKVLAELKSKNV